METKERRAGDDLREAIVDYIYSDPDAEDIDRLALINLRIEELEKKIKDLKKQSEKHAKRWLEENHKVAQLEYLLEKEKEK